MLIEYFIGPQSLFTALNYLTCGITGSSLLQFCVSWQLNLCKSVACHQTLATSVCGLIPIPYFPGPPITAGAESRVTAAAGEGVVLH